MSDSAKFQALVYLGLAALGLWQWFVFYYL